MEMHAIRWICMPPRFFRKYKNPLWFWLLMRSNYCKRFAQSAGPWFGHRFAQSAGPRSPLRSVRCAMEICCISQPLCHHFIFLYEFRTLFDTVFRSLGSLLEDMGNTFTIWNEKRQTVGTPIVILPDITSTFGTHFGVSFETFSSNIWVLQVSFSVLFHSYVFSWFLVRFMVSGTLKIHQNQRRVV